MKNLIKNTLNQTLRRALHHPWRMVAGSVVFIALGLMAFKAMSFEAYPDFTLPMVRVITMMPGKGAEEVERLVSIPLEKELSGLPGSTIVRSQSIFGLSVVRIIFEEGVSTPIARQQVLERLQNADLPPDAKPRLDPDASPIGEIYRYTLESPYYNPMNVKASQDWLLEKLFRQVPGVVDVTSFGGPTKTYQVKLDPGRLVAFGLTPLDVYQALASSNSTSGGNTINNNGEAFVVRGLGLLQNENDINNTVIQTREDGTPIRIRDVATVAIEPGLRLGQVGKNEQDDVVQGIVLMRRGQDPSKVIQNLYGLWDDIQAKLPDGIVMQPLYDRMDLLRKTLHTISENVLHGIGLVIAVLLIFLFEWRSALIAASVIPMALLGAFMLLYSFHIPANLLSLGAVDFGIIVDSTVVMVEAILHALSHASPGMDLNDRVMLVYQAAADVAQPILFATIIISTAFLPILAFDGVAGKLFHPLAYTMNFALISAVVASITVIPALCMLVLGRNKTLKAKTSPVFSLVEKLTRPMIQLAMKYAKWVVSGLVVCTIITGILFTQLGTEFLPALDEGNIWLRVTMLPTSSSLDEAVHVAHEVRRIVMQYPEVKNVVSQIGSPDDGTDANPPSNIEFLIDLHDAPLWREQWHEKKESLVQAMDKDLDTIPGILTTFSQYIQDNVDEAIAGAKGQVAVQLSGPDLTVLQHLGNQISALLRQVNGMVDVANDQLLGQPQYKVQIQRDNSSRYGLNADAINNLLEVAVGGKEACQLYEGERKFDVVVRFSKPYRNSFDALNTLLIATPVGSSIPISEVSSLTSTSGAISIFRANGSRIATAKANVRERDLGSSVQDAQKLIQKNITLPAGYTMSWGGQYENQQRANGRLMIAIPIALACIYVLLWLAFKRHRLVWISLTAVPLACIGGVGALALTHTYFSVSAGVGLIAAIGVSVQSAVLCVSALRTYLEMNTPLNQAVFNGIMDKLRPVFMAGTVAILGLIPAATSNGIGSQSQKPFAIAIIGGLLVSTLAIPPLLAAVTQVLKPTCSAKKGTL